jgi:hydroxymethylglutaryl-CoA lyase
MTAAHVIEVGPRDGLQYEAVVDLQVRVTLIEKLTQAGLNHIEVGSFVSPQKVPQMANTDLLVSQLSREKKALWSALIPNLKGMNHALKAGIDQVAVFAAATESFSQKNLNCNIQTSLQRYQEVCKLAQQEQIPIRGYVSCVLGCPYEGQVPIGQVIDVAEALLNMGCSQISLGDTIGVGTATPAKQLVRALKQHLDADQIALHFHDTYGQALCNIYACLDEGIRHFDSAIAGLGGCPFAPGASGNLATEDLVYFLHGQGLPTGIDLEQLMHASHFISQALQVPNRSKVAQAYLKC